MGLFDKLKQGLEKTHQLLHTDIRDLFKAQGRLVDESFHNDLFEKLVKIDMGVDAAQEIADARKRLPRVTLTQTVEKLGLSWIKRLKIDSHRTELTLFEAACAHAAADSRLTVTVRDLRVIAPLALRQRRSPFMTQFFQQQAAEDRQIREIVHD